MAAPMTPTAIAGANPRRDSPSDTPTSPARSAPRGTTAGGGTSRAPAKLAPAPDTDPPGCEPHPTVASPNPMGHASGGGSSPRVEGPAITSPEPTLAAPDPRPWQILRVVADSYWDLMATRIALQQRAAANPLMADYIEPMIAGAEHVEHQAELELRRTFRRQAPDLYRWTQQQHGLGVPTMARLLGIIGHPGWAWPHVWVDIAPDRHECGRRCGKRHLVALEPHPRTLAQLWSYCRVGDPTRKARKGMGQDDAMALGVARARAVLHVMSEAAMKVRSERYRPVYDAAREQYAERDWTDGHRHQAALRRVAKEILRDLWLASG